MTSSTHQRPFLDVLAELSKGRTKEELTEALHDLVVAVEDTGKKGFLTLKLTIEPDRNSDIVTMRVSDQIAVNLPRADKKSSLFYAADGNLQRDNPMQQAFEPLRDVSAPATPADQEEAR